MSNAGRQQLGLQPEKLRNVKKIEHMPSHDLHIWQDVCTKMLQTSGGIQPLLQAYACSQEATILLQEKVSHTGRHKLA